MNARATRPRIRGADFAMESTFVTGVGDGGYDVRIFTPGLELPFKRRIVSSLLPKRRATS